MTERTHLEYNPTGAGAKHILYALVDHAAGKGEEYHVDPELLPELRYYIGLIPDDVKQDGLELVRAAVRWAKKDYKTFKLIRRIVVLEAEDPSREVWKADENGTLHLVGYKPLIRGELYAIARRRGWKIEGGEFDRSNNHWSTISRAIMMQRPITCRILNTAKAKVDDIDIMREWLELMPSEFFPASTLEEAHAACDMGDITALPRRKK